MNILLELSFIFFIGSVFGWVTELLFRRFTSSANHERKWINPGFCTGPYLPLYGVGLCVLFLVANLEKYRFTQNSFLNKIVLFIIMSILMTVIEYIAGIIALKVSNIRLWDYSDKWGNIKGIICPEFSLIWALRWFTCSRGKPRASGVRLSYNIQKPKDKESLGLPQNANAVRFVGKRRNDRVYE